MEMPGFEPNPPCGLTHEDVTYTLVGGSGIPDWVTTFDESTRTVTIETTASDERLS